MAGYLWDLTATSLFIFTQYIKDLSPLLRSAPIFHQYTEEMSRRSEVAVLYVLMDKEAYHSDMVDIMKTVHSYLGSDYPSHGRVSAGGDQCHNGT